MRYTAGTVARKEDLAFVPGDMAVWIGEGGRKTVVFDKPGTVSVECATHPVTKMMVEVEA